MTAEQGWEPLMGEVRPRNPVFLGEGRPTDDEREQFVKDITEMNKVVFEELAKGADHD